MVIDDWTCTFILITSMKVVKLWAGLDHKLPQLTTGQVNLYGLILEVSQKEIFVTQRDRNYHFRLNSTILTISAYS